MNGIASFKHELKITRKVIKSMKNIDKQIREEISTRLKELANGMNYGVVLKGPWKGYKRIRVRKYRVIYRIPQKCIIEVVYVGHGETVY